VTDQETWFWHAYFGMPVSCNDLNVLRRSPLFAPLANGEPPPMEFHIHHGYYLVDEIYPDWATFVKPITSPQGKKEHHFHNGQAAARKGCGEGF
jgi:hypothetical protein